MGSWNYTLLANDDAMDFMGSFIYTCASNLSDKEYERFGKFDDFKDLPLEDRQYIINKNFDKLLTVVKEDGRMDGYITLGVFIMENGAILSKDDKTFILKNLKNLSMLVYLKV